MRMKTKTHGANIFVASHLRQKMSPNKIPMALKDDCISVPCLIMDQA